MTKTRSPEPSKPGQRRMIGRTLQWMKAKQSAAEAARAVPVPGSLMYRRSPPAQTATAWKWNRARSEAMARAQRWPLGFGRS